MNHKKNTALAAAIATTPGGVGAAAAASIDIGLTNVASYTSGGTSAGNISSSTATWSYDTVTNVLTQTGGTFNVRFNITPGTTLFRHSITGLVIGNGAAGSTTTYACAEGNFGGIVGASLCGNYNFGANFVNESSSTWGPGTAFARTLLGDDGSVGAQQSIAAYNGFITSSWNGTALVIGNNTATTGYSWTLSTVPVPGAVWLFGSALGLMGVMRRKISS